MTFDYEAALVWPEDRASPRLGIRFDAQGRFLPEAGNTVVAQVVPGSATEALLVDLRAALMALPVARHFAFTAVPSYHMTVFEGVIESRRADGYWPADLPLDLTIDAATARMIDRLHGWTPLPGFAMQVTEATPLGLRLAGATPADEAVARRWRDDLSAALGLRTPQHDSYGFHITLAYVMTPLSAADLPGLRSRMAELTAFVQAAIPVVHLARPAFCRFADMNAFPPVLPL